MVDRAEVMAALHTSSQRFLDLAGSLTAAEGARPVPHLTWNVGETVAHVLTVVRRGYADRRRSETAEATADLNDLVLDEEPERDVVVLTELLREAVHTALDVVYPKIPEDRVFDFHGGMRTTMTPALRIVLGEFVVHGWDIAVALDRPWTITDTEARALVPTDLWSGWVRPDAAEQAYEVRVGADPPLRFEVGPGRLHVEPGEGGRPVTLAPADFVLAFYGRRVPDDDALINLLMNFIPS